MRILFFTIIGLFWSLTSSGQVTNKFFFDFNYSMNTYMMGDVNTFYIDSFAGIPENDFYREKLKRGNNFNIGINYSPIRYLSIGVFGGYQYASLKSYKWHEYLDSELGKTIYTKRQFELKPEAWALGIAGTFYFSELIFSKKVVQRTHFGIESKGSINSTKITSSNVLFTFYTSDNSKIYYHKYNLGVCLGILTEYDITQSPIITTIGLRMGYQWLKTGVMKDAANQEWLVNDKYPINLDFSGLYYGVYLKIGK
ncbi:MAG: hypothetical protein H3C31_02085 [Brumimicrobium sp.]|nr:hypothetical protein [Brumimicrobium sp.]